MKVFKKIMVSLLLLIGGVSLFACSHEHSIMGDYHYNEEKHWQECFECDLKFNVETHNFGEWILNSDKTQESRTCECGYVDTRPYDDPHPHCTFTNYINNNDATCTKNATETAKCDYCNKTDTREIEDSKLPHSFTNYENNEDATCSSNATETAKCDHCTKTHTREIEGSKLPHTFINYISNNNATCSSNATETAKCEKCEATNTKDIENTKLEHTLGDLIEKSEPNCTQTGMEAHYQCSVCHKYLTTEKVETTLEELTIPVKHNYGDWNVTLRPTFEDEGKRIRTCECGEIEEQDIPVLIAVDEVYIENENTKVMEDGSEIILSGLVAPVDAENYEVEWISTNDSLIEVVFVNNTYKAIVKEITGDENSVDVSLTFKATNILNGEEYSSASSSFTITVVAKKMVAEFTFENGLTNTGAYSNIEGYLFSNANDNRGEKLDVDPSTYIISSHVVGNTTYQLGSNGLISSHVSSRPSFGISGLDMGSGDFAISWKHYMPSDFIKANYASKNEQWCVMSVNSAANSDNKLFIYLGKDSSGAGFFRPISNLNGSKVNLYEYNKSGYYSGRKWTEYRVVKQGTTVTVTIVPASSETNAKCVAYSIVYTLESADDFTLTPDQVIGFGNNYGSTRPGNDSYYDDIKVWNYAHDFE